MARGLLVSDLALTIFFSLSSLILAFDPPNLPNSSLIYFFLDLVLILFITIFLFEIICKIKFFFF